MGSVYVKKLREIYGYLNKTWIASQKRLRGDSTQINFVPQAIRCKFHVRLYTKFCMKASNSLQVSTTSSAETEWCSAHNMLQNTWTEVQYRLCHEECPHWNLLIFFCCSRHSQWQCGLRRGSKAASCLALRFSMPLGAWLSVSCECCVWSSRGRSLDPRSPTNSGMSECDEGNS